MNLFTVLTLVSAGLALLALVRSRPAAMMIALNQVVMLRALDNICSYGQPLSEAFLPGSIFTDRNLDIAKVISLITTGLLGMCLVIQPRTRARPVRPVFPPLPRWLLAILVGYILVATFSSGSLSSHAYSGEAGSVGGTALGGLNALLISLCLYEILRRSVVGAMKPWAGLGIILLILFLTQFSKGSTGLATGYGLCAVMFFWPIEGPHPFRRAMLSVGVLSAVVVLAYTVRGIRTVYYERGLASVGEYFAGAFQGEAERAQEGEGAEKGGNGTQYACHTLECIQLYEAGISRGWRSIYDPVMYTAEPSFLLGRLGWSRPIEAAYELSEYYVHGGGTYLLGELYWNGGYFCVVLVFGLLMVLIFFCDTRYRQSAFWLMMSAQFAPELLMGMGYGFNQVIRGAINALLIMGTYWLMGILTETANRATYNSALHAQLSASRKELSGRQRVTGAQGPTA